MGDDLKQFEADQGDGTYKDEDGTIRPVKNDAPPATETENTMETATAAPPEKPVEKKTDTEWLDELIGQCRVSSKLLKRGPEYGKVMSDEILAKVRDIVGARGE